MFLESKGIPNCLWYVITCPMNEFWVIAMSRWFMNLWTRRIPTAEPCLCFLRTATIDLKHLQEERGISSTFTGLFYRYANSLLTQSSDLQGSLWRNSRHTERSLCISWMQSLGSMTAEYRPKCPKLIPNRIRSSHPVRVWWIWIRCTLCSNLVPWNKTELIQSKLNCSLT